MTGQTFPVRVDMHASMQTELGSDQFMVIPLVHLDFVGSPLFAWGGIGDHDWNGDTYLGVGDLGGINPIKADARGGISKLELSLNSLPDPSLLSLAKNEDYVGRNGQVWLACFDEGLNRIGDPVLFFAGEISIISLIDSGREQSVTVTLDSRLAILKRPMPRNRTQEDQKRNDPTDQFFAFVAGLPNKTIYWGLKAPSSGSGRVSGGGASRYFGGRINLNHN